MSVSNEDELKRILEMLPMPAFVFDGDAKRFIRANHAFCDLVGYSEQELRDLSWPLIMADPQQESAAERAMSEPRFNTAISWNYRHKNGSVVAITSAYRAMSFIRNSGEMVSAFFAAVMDVPESKAPSGIEMFKP